MNYIHLKINRLLYPLISIVAITAIYLLFALFFAKESAAFILFAFFIISFINAFLYFILHLVLGIFIKNDIASIFVCSSLSFLISGKAFRIMHWPGWQFQLYTGYTLLALALLSFVLILAAKFKEE